MPATRTQRVRTLEQRTQDLRQAGDYRSNEAIEYVTDSAERVIAPTRDVVEFETESGLVMIVCVVLVAAVDAAAGAVVCPYLDGAPLDVAFRAPEPEAFIYDVILDALEPVSAEDVAAPDFASWMPVVTGGGQMNSAAQPIARGLQGSFDRDGIMMLSVGPGRHTFELRYRAAPDGQLAVCDRRVLVVSL